MNISASKTTSCQISILYCILAIILTGMNSAQGQDSTVLTDKVYKGTGTIDLLKDVSAYDLETAILTTGKLTLGIDVNESASGSESSLSMGVALDAVTLTIKTTTGDYEFTDFYTNTTAVITDPTSGEKQEYFTAFGATGSNSITSDTANFDISNFDDVILLQNLSAIEGDILSANLDINFVYTGNRTNSTEDFFDFSNGFEDFALLSERDSVALEENAAGISDAPAGIEYVESPSLVVALVNTDNFELLEDSDLLLPNTPAAPAPPVLLLMGAAMLMTYFAIKKRRSK